MVETKTEESPSREQLKWLFRLGLGRFFSQEKTFQMKFAELGPVMDI